MSKFLFIFYIIIGLIIFPDIAKSVYFASDRIMLYEGREEIIDSSVIWLASYKTYSERCEKGRCVIGQQFYPVTIYKTKLETPLTGVEFPDQGPYECDKFDGKCKDRRNAKKSEDYLKYLEQNSSYSMVFNPGVSQGGEECESGNTIDGGCGRIGDDRDFDLDIVSGKFVRK